MTAFLLHDRLESVDEFGRKKSRPFSQREKPEGEKGIDAFAKAGEQERPFGMARRLVFGLWREPDSIGLDEVGKNLLVSCFLEPVDFDRFPQQRVRERLGIAQHP